MPIPSLPPDSLNCMKHRIILVLLLLSSSLIAQQHGPGNAEIEKIYTRAIGDFIKDAQINHQLKFDTLFFGKRKNGEPDDFPDIDLPERIENTAIVLVSTELGARIMKERPSRIYVNMMGWIEKDKAEFILFVFSKGFVPQFNYTIHYTLSGTNKALVLSKIVFKGSPVK